MVSATTIKELDRIQNSLACFILQLPRSASTLTGVLDAGLMLLSKRELLLSSMILLTYGLCKQMLLFPSLIKDQYS